MRQLSVALGATAHAAAATLAIFFAGLGLGSYLWGERAAATPSPLRGYARLELGVGLAALGFFWVEPVTALLERVLHAPGLASGVVAVLLLVPPAVFMGGTLPMMGEHMIRSREQLGRTGALLYAVNTAGGATGALAAGFYLPARLGVRGSCALAIGASLLTAAAAAWLSRAPSSARRATGPDAERRPAAAAAADGRQSARLLRLAFLSGFVALGLEVLWTRMFAQVLHNSVYSFAAILVVFLVALGSGAVLARRLCRAPWPPQAILVALLAASGVAVGLTPRWFVHVTDGMSYVAPGATWSGYVAAVFGKAALVLLPPGILLGTTFPYLLRLASPAAGSAGKAIGRLGAANTAGAIAGSLTAGFVVLPWLGLWGGIKSLALVYLVTAAHLAPGEGSRWPLRGLALAAVLAFATVLDPTRLPLARIDARAGEVLHAAWESAHGITAVVEKKDSLQIRLDGYYTLGGTSALSYEKTQADVPLLLHPSPRSVFFIGLGTGITAGAALAHDVERVVAAELVPDVVTASREHFAAFTGGLFDDPRAVVRVGDGRRLLRAEPATYDVIVSDLFIPWQAGAGSLYTREHFATVRERLAPGGLFALWLPLYQLSREATLVIARTMLDVFPQVTVWRGDFLPGRSIVALVGQVESTPLDPDAMVAGFRYRRPAANPGREDALALTGLFYAGNLGASRELLADVPANTDDRPLIEFAAPITHRSGGASPWFVGPSLLAWYAELARRAPIDDDPYLARLTPRERDYFRAGHLLFASKVAQAAGDPGAAESYAAAFRALVPAQLAPLTDERGATPD